MAKKNVKKEEVKTPKIKIEKDVVLVEFVKGWTPYVVGEIAGFKKSLAEQLIKGGRAVEYIKK